MVRMRMVGVGLLKNLAPSISDVSRWMGGVRVYARQIRVVKTKSVRQNAYQTLTQIQEQ